MIHKGLAGGRWFELPTIEQFANIGVDVDRALRWRKKNDAERSREAFWRALELIDLTVADPKNSKGTKKEMLRAREMLVDYLDGDNIYRSTDEAWHNYFFWFNYVAAIRRGR